MPDDPLHNPGGATEPGPADSGTTDASAQTTAAQGVEKGGQEGAAPQPQEAAGGTTEPGVLDLSPADEPQPQPREEREAHYETRWRETMGTLRKQHPDWFDEQGNPLESPRAAQPQAESGFLDLTPEGAAQQPAEPQAEPAVAKWESDVLQMLNAQLEQAQINSEGPLDYEQRRTRIINSYVRQNPQLAPYLIPGAALQPQRGGGLTEEQVAKLADERATNIVRMYDQRTAAFQDKMDVLEETLPQGWLDQKLRGVKGIPSGTPIRKALVMVCEDMGVADPWVGALMHPQLGKAIFETKVAHGVQAEIARRAAKGDIEGVPFPGGVGGSRFPARGATAEVEAAGFQTKKPSP
jgi:hypothetical protein